MAPLVVAVLALACSRAQSRAPTVIPATAPQLIIAIVDDWEATKATLQVWKRDGDRWAKDGDAWPAVIGKSGAAWGDGLHGNGAPEGATGGVKGPIKREGDGRSPAGAFALRGAYGYADKAPKSKLAYTPLTPSWQCVDDPKSAHYATILDRSTVKVDWSSAETMRRDDALYTWVVDVAHNAARTPNAGSCIFLHVWSGPDSTTVGCTAMAEPKLADLVTRLDPRAVFVLLPRAAYDALAPRWGLPR